MPLGDRAIGARASRASFAKPDPLNPSSRGGRGRLIGSTFPFRDNVSFRKHATGVEIGANWHSRTLVSKGIRKSILKISRCEKRHRDRRITAALSGSDDSRSALHWDHRAAGKPKGSPTNQGNAPTHRRSGAAVSNRGGRDLDLEFDGNLPTIELDSPASAARGPGQIGADSRPRMAGACRYSGCRVEEPSNVYVDESNGVTVPPAV